jgi:phage terminase small subunit
MTALKNPRHEKFALALSEGKSATEAYTAAGYKPCRQNAARLTTNDDIQARLAEIQGAAAKSAEVTVQSLLDELEHARSRADGLDQLSAAVKAISEKAKISGLLVQRVEVGGVGAFDNCDSREAVADALMDEYESLGDHAFDEEPAEAFTALILRHSEEVAAFIASCKTRPSLQGTSPADLPWQEFKQQRDARRGQRLLPPG